MDSDLKCVWRVVHNFVRSTTVVVRGRRRTMAGQLGWSELATCAEHGEMLLFSVLPLLRWQAVFTQ